MKTCRLQARLVAHQNLWPRTGCKLSWSKGSRLSRAQPFPGETKGLRSAPPKKMAGAARQVDSANLHAGDLRSLTRNRHGKRSLGAEQLESMGNRISSAQPCVVFVLGTQKALADSKQHCCAPNVMSSDVADNIPSPGRAVSTNISIVHDPPSWTGILVAAT